MTILDAIIGWYLIGLALSFLATFVEVRYRHIGGCLTIMDCFFHCFPAIFGPLMIFVVINQIVQILSVKEFLNTPICELLKWK